MNSNIFIPKTINVGYQNRSGTYTGTEEKMVVYQSLKDKRVWIRPYEMFISKVDREKYPNADQSYRLIKVKITA